MPSSIAAFNVSAREMGALSIWIRRDSLFFLTELASLTLRVAEAGPSFDETRTPTSNGTTGDNCDTLLEDRVFFTGSVLTPSELSNSGSCWLKFR
jgi:hypothetical protein